MEKTVIVTGTGKGLGLALCHQLLTNNYKVIAVSRTLTEEFKVLQLKRSDKLFFYEYDFSDTTNISKLVKKSLQSMGGLTG